MRSLLRFVYNLLYKSAHRFDDGSALYYHPVYCIIRYYTGESIRRIADVPVIYDESSGMERIDTNAMWRWREPGIPLGEPSNSGPALSVHERSDLLRKLQVFVAQAPRWFEPFKGDL
jgi:hypothetical protein